MGAVITSIDRHSPAERAGVRTGETLLSIGGHPVEDVLDYRFFGYDRDPELVLESLGGSRRTVRVKKPEAAELGLDDMHAFTPQIDILAALHEKGTQRMFMN